MRRGLVLALLALLAGAGAQEAAPLELSGKAWTDSGPLLSWAEGAEPARPDYGYLGDAGLRLSLTNRDRSVMRFEAAAEAVLLAGASAEPARAALDALAAALRLPPALLLSLGAPGDDEALLSLSLKKLSLRYDADFVAVCAGRQIVNFGKAALFSPVDIYSLPSLSGLQTGRDGMDCLRLTLPLGALGAADAVARPGRKVEDGDYGARIAGSLGPVDLAASGAYRGGLGEWLAGLEAQSGFGLGQARIDCFAEAALSLPSRKDEGENGARLRASAGLGFSPLTELSLRGEYYFNGKALEYGYRQSSGGIDHLGTYPAPHYGLLVLSWAPSDFWSLAATALQAIGKDEEASPGLAALRWSYSGYPGTAIGASALCSWGGGRGMTAALELSTSFSF